MTILWQNGTGDPKRVGGDDWTKDEDFTEIVEQINRRRLLEYRAEDAALDDPFDPALWMRAPSVAALRYEFTGNDLIHPPVGGLGGQPPTPSYMRWLWPEADADEDKPITLAVQALDVAVGFQHNMYIQPRLLPGENPLWLEAAVLNDGAKLQAEWIYQLASEERRCELRLERPDRAQKNVFLEAHCPSEILMTGIRLDCL